MQLKVRVHRTTVLVVDGCSLLSLVPFLRDEEGLGAFLTITTTTTLPCSYYVALEDYSKSKAWERGICKRQHSYTNFPLESMR
jgi:hypothetical protein